MPLLAIVTCLAQVDINYPKISHPSRLAKPSAGASVAPYTAVGLQGKVMVI